MKTVLHLQKRTNCSTYIVFITIIAFIFSFPLVAENTFNSSLFSANDTSVVELNDSNPNIPSTGTTVINLEKDNSGRVKVNISVTSHTKDGVKSENKFYFISKDSVYEEDKRPAFIVNNNNLTNAEICSLDLQMIGNIIYYQGKNSTDKFGEVGKNGAIVITMGQNIYSDEVTDSESSPLYVVNGRIVDKTEAEHIDLSEIKTKKMYDSSSAEAEKYGDKAKNGVVIITIK